MAMKRTELSIELLYFDGCPGYKPAWENLLEAMVEAEVDATIAVRNVEEPSRAAELRFPGSPTIRVNGRDLEGLESDGVLVCRVYRDNEGQGWPSKDQIVARLREAVAAS